MSDLIEDQFTSFNFPAFACAAGVTAVGIYDYKNTSMWNYFVNKSI